MDVLLTRKFIHLQGGSDRWMFEYIFTVISLGLYLAC